MLRSVAVEAPGPGLSDPALATLVTGSHLPQSCTERDACSAVRLWKRLAQRAVQHHSLDPALATLVRGLRLPQS